MSMMDKDSVTWTRVAPNGIDALGHPVLATVAGFPRTVTGNFQTSTRSATPRPEGLGVRLDARFFSDTFVGGLIGDLVTFGGRQYKVESATPRLQLFSSSVAFMNYGLSLVQSGVAQTPET